MAKKNSIIGTAPGNPPGMTQTKTRKALTPAAQELLDQAKQEVAAGKNKMKEAKALGKIIECVNSLGEWGLGQLELAIAVRKSGFKVSSESADSQ